MTSSGLCHQCGKPAHSFFYRTPRRDAFDGHDGYWHCADHGPELTLKDNQITEASRGKSLMTGMNRAERRAFKKKGREPA